MTTGEASAVEAAAIPPQNLEAEEGILGRLLLAGDYGAGNGSVRVDEAIGLLEADDFYRPSHGRIFAAICSLHAVGAPIDQVSVAFQLEDAAALEDVGGRSRLGELAQLATAPANVVHHARIVRETAEQRRGERSARDGGVALRVVSADEFAAVDEPSADPLLGEPDDVVIAAGSLTVFYGDGGAGKTTLAIDLVTHLASGTPWLGFDAPARARVLLVEAEGPRGLFRRKLRRKVEGWEGRPWTYNVFVLEEPWARASLVDESFRSALAGELSRLEIDILVAGPVKRLGIEGGGTPDEVSRFVDLVAQLRGEVERPVAVVLIHHENKAGGISGAWSGEPDTLVHVRPDGRERTIVHLEKARWASAAHGQKLTLAWAEHEGFEVVDRGGVPTAAARSAEEAEALEWLVAYVEEQHAASSAGVPKGEAETAYHEAHEKHGRNLARRVIDRQIEAFEAWICRGGTGENPSALARGPGERAHGVYLYPSNYAPSPLAAGGSGENGENQSRPPSDDPSRHLAARPKGGEMSGEKAAGVAAEADEEVSVAELERLEALARDTEEEEASRPPRSPLGGRPSHTRKTTPRAEGSR